MKEMIGKTLTRKPETPYSRYVGKLMAEGVVAELRMEGVATKPASPQANETNLVAAGSLAMHFKEKGLNVRNVDTARTIKMMEDAGVNSQNINQGELRKTLKEASLIMKRNEVMKNALLDDSGRIEKAAQVLKRELADKERTAILEAHRQGIGEAGKDAGEAGVYNYTKTQLLRKARILEEAGFSRDERRALMEAGLVGREPVDKSGITDPAVKAEMDAMNVALDAGVDQSFRLLGDYLVNINRLKAKGANPVDVEAAQKKIKVRLDSEMEAVGREHEEQETTYRFGLSLMKGEMRMLMSDPMAWLYDQFDKVYAQAEQGSELASPAIQNTQNKIAYAVDLIDATNQENLKQFIDESANRMHLLQMRTAIGMKDMEQIKGAAGQLRAHGLLLGMQLEGGKVGAMFNRFQDKLEEARLLSNRRHHVMLEDVKKVQDELVIEQMELAKKGKGGFESLADISSMPEFDREFDLAINDKNVTNLRVSQRAKVVKEAIAEDDKAGKEGLPRTITREKRTQLEREKESLERIRKIKKVNADITRNVRTAYDVFVSSQRMGVVVSRGKYLLKGTTRYRSDPIGPLNVYNMEDLTSGRFDMFSAEQEKFADVIKLDMANAYLKQQKMTQRDRYKEPTEEQKLDLGKRLFRDIFAVPDYFSSGWRVEGVIQALEQRFEANIAKRVNEHGGFESLLINEAEKKDYGELKSDSEKKMYRDKIVRKRAADRAGDFALFMRLRGGGQDQLLGDKEKTEKREKLWKKINDYRPEEIVRLFRERDSDRVKELYEKMSKLDSELALTPEEKLANRPDAEGGRGRDLTVYDKFKQKYGAAIGLLRQEGYDRVYEDEVTHEKTDILAPEQINLSNLSADQRKTVDAIKGPGSGDLLIKLSHEMKTFIGENDLIKDLLERNEFADIYVRSIIIDDALLDKLEDEKSDVLGKAGASELGYVPFSKMVGEVGSGNDTLTRSWNDTDNAIKAGNTLINEFFKEEDLEKKMQAALKFAGLASAYNGLGSRGQAECIRYTIGTYLNLTKLDMVWDIIGTKAMPFRIPISEAQRIFGTHISPEDRDSLRKKFEHLRGFMNGSISKNREDVRERTKEILENDVVGENRAEVVKAILSEKEMEDVEKRHLSDTERDELKEKKFREKVEEVELSEAEQAEVSPEKSESKIKEDKLVKELMIKALEDKLKHDEEDSEKFIKDLEELFQVTSGDSVKRTGLKSLLYLLLAAIGEGYTAGKSALPEVK